MRFVRYLLIAIQKLLLLFVVVVVLVRTIAANNTLAETETACRYGLLTVYRMLVFQSMINASVL